MAVLAARTITNPLTDRAGGESIAAATGERRYGPHERGQALVSPAVHRQHRSNCPGPLKRGRALAIELLTIRPYIVILVAGA